MKVNVNEGWKRAEDSENGRVLASVKGVCFFAVAQREELSRSV